MKELWALNFNLVLTIILISSCSVKGPKPFSSIDNTDEKAEMANLVRIKFKKIQKLEIIINNLNQHNLKSDAYSPKNDQILRNFLVKLFYKSLTDQESEYNENPLKLIDLAPLNHFSFNDLESFKEKIQDLNETNVKIKISFYIEIDSPPGISELTNLRATLFSYNPYDHTLTELSKKLLLDTDFKRILIQSKNQHLSYNRLINLSFEIPIQTLKETLNKGLLAIKITEFNINKTNTYSESLDKELHFLSTKNNFKSLSNLEEINPLENSLEAPINFNSLENLNKGLWGFLKLENLTIKIYATKSDFLTSNQNKEVLEFFTLENRKNLMPKYPNETLIFSIKGFKTLPKLSTPIKTSLEAGSLEKNCMSLMREPRECQETFKYGKWCGITHTTPTGGSRKLLIINSLSDIGFKIQGVFKKKIINDLLRLIPNNNYFINKNKTLLKLKLELSTLNPITLVNKDPEPFTLTYGLTAFNDCEIRHATGFKFKNFNPGPHTITKFKKEHYEIKLERIGFNEN